MVDRRTLLEHIKQDTELARQLLTQPTCDYQTLRSGFLKMTHVDFELISSSKIKQVYFHIVDDKCHLLSLLTHSGHLFELRHRIDALWFSDEIRQARECRRQRRYHADGYREILGVTAMGFGGSKPQNVSVLNSQNAGEAYLLASLPPKLISKHLRCPKYDFFSESVTPNQTKGG